MFAMNHLSPSKLTCRGSTINHSSSLSLSATSELHGPKTTKKGENVQGKTAGEDRKQRKKGRETWPTARQWPMAATTLSLPFSRIIYLSFSCMKCMPSKLGCGFLEAQLVVRMDTHVFHPMASLVHPFSLNYYKLSCPKIIVHSSPFCI